MAENSFAHEDINSSLEAEQNESVVATEYDRINSLTVEISRNNDASKVAKGIEVNTVDIVTNESVDSITATLTEIEIDGSSMHATPQLSVGVDETKVTNIQPPPPPMEADGKPLKMAVYWNSICKDHYIPDHPEQPARVESILKGLRSTFSDRLVFRQARMINEEELLLFHVPNLLTRFEMLNKKVNGQKNKKTARVVIDEDTSVMYRTKQSAYYAAGGVLSALDDMYSTDDGKVNDRFIDTAFVCVRPPGHHAERNKSCGFCFFNNVGIGAKYAQHKYGVHKVAVLDFDVHHGNGTEEGFMDDSTLFYGSTHGRDHFPNTGKDPSPRIGDFAESEVYRRIVNRELDPGPQSRDQFREKWLQILQEMERFKPDLVIMSAGFDAHVDDPLASIELEVEDYFWVTQQILVSCAKIDYNRLAADDGNMQPIRYLSVLEGGYNLEAIQKCAIAHVDAMLLGTSRFRGLYSKDQSDDSSSTHGGDEIAALQEHLASIGLK